MRGLFCYVFCFGVVFMFLFNLGHITSIKDT